MAKKNTGKSGLISTDATVAVNKRARFDYTIEETFVAGIELTGTEVKSLRHGQTSIQEAYVGPTANEMWLHNANIPEYQQASQHLQHEPQRTRRLLLHRREINRLIGAVTREGYTIVPIKMYFNKRGIAKLEIGLGKGKKQHDKREAIKKRDWGREKQRVMKEHG